MGSKLKPTSSPSDDELVNAVLAVPGGTSSLVLSSRGHSSRESGREQIDHYTRVLLRPDGGARLVLYNEDYDGANPDSRRCYDLKHDDATYTIADETVNIKWGEKYY